MIAEHHLAVQRTARYYTLGGSSGDAARDVRELWMVCHGYGQLAAAFIKNFAVFASPSRLVVAPEALSRFYLDPNRKAADPDPRVGATWMTREDRDHEIGDQVRYLDQLYDHVRAELAPGIVRLRILGFSQGVATAARWLAFGHVRAHELILWAGSFPADIELAPFAERLAGAPVVLVRGERDELSSWANADVQLERFEAAGITARLVTFAGGHRLDSGTLISIAEERLPDDA